jgi:hypothetical protein
MEFQYTSGNFHDEDFHHLGYDAVQSSENSTQSPEENIVSIFGVEE